MLRLENVSYRYRNGERDVVKDVTCEFEDGKISAVMGPSGSGKTTLLSLLAGLDKPVSGNVFIDADNLAGLNLDQYRKERVSMIFQAFHLFPLLTALENVCYPMAMNGIVRFKALERAKVLLNSVEIGDELHKRYPSNLSGGEQQRVAISRALATGARVLLADEPTGNLDAQNGEIIMTILRRLAHEEKYCIVVVTHNQAIAEASDMVYRMKDGGLAPNR